MNVYINKKANEALRTAYSIINDMIEKIDESDLKKETIDELKEFSEELHKLYLKSIK